MTNIGKQKIIFVLFIAVLIQLYSFFYYLEFFNQFGYFPEPFFLNKSDTLMDFYSTLFWAKDDGRYTKWGSVYPPLVFLIYDRLYDFIVSSPIKLSGIALREADSILFPCYVTTSLASLLFMAYTKIYDNVSNSHKFLWFFYFSLSSPFLFAIERGNFIVFCPLILAIALGSNNLIRSIIFAFLVNLKPYFIVLLSGYFFKRRYNEFLIALCLCVIIFITSGTVMDQNFILFLSSLFNFSNKQVFDSNQILSFTASSSVFNYVLNFGDQNGALKNFLSLPMVSITIKAITVVNLLLLINALYIFVKCSRFCTIEEIVFLSCLLISNLILSVGPYFIIIYVVFIPLVYKFKRNYLGILIIIMIFFPLDLIWGFHLDYTLQYSWLGGNYIPVGSYLTLGTFLRPVLNQLLFMVTLHEFNSRVNCYAVMNKFITGKLVVNLFSRN